MRDSLTSALHIYCLPDETLAMMDRETKEEAARFLVANDVPYSVVSREIGMPIERVIEVTAGAR
jgi:hypothetical protein